MEVNLPLTSLVNDAVEDDSNSEMDYDSDATIPLSTSAYLDIGIPKSICVTIDLGDEVVV